VESSVLLPDDFHTVRGSLIVSESRSKTEYRKSHRSGRDPGPGFGMCSFDQAGLSSTNGEPNVQPASTIPSTTWSLSLPPLRSIDPLRQFASNPAPDSELSARHPPLGLPPIAQYPPQLTGAPPYYGISPRCHLGSYRGSGAPSVQMNLVPHASHVPIAPSESHHLIAGGRNKREVKRRTKTGCRTCRKRRIKVRHLSLGLKYDIE
jgi:hypothetical protein